MRKYTTLIQPEIHQYNLNQILYKIVVIWETRVDVIVTLSKIIQPDIEKDFSNNSLLFYLNLIKNDIPIYKEGLHTYNSL